MTRLTVLLTGLAAMNAAAFAQPTYSKEVSRIVQARCQGCHRPNDIAPFPLTSFEEVQVYAPDIQRVLDQRIMPPWKPVQAHGVFRGAFALTDAERQTLLDWVAAGAPEGKAEDLPEARAPQGDWPLGDPDLVLKMAEAYRPPLGKDMYRCFVLPTGLPEDRFVTAADVLPGVRSAVHHVILYLDTTGEAEKLDAKDDGPGYTCYGGPGTPGLNIDASGISLSSLLNIGGTLGGWAPGQRPMHLPDGIGMFLDKKARIVMQIHYYSTRLSGDDQTRIGLYFAKKPVDRRLLWLPVVPLDERGRLRMEIPAGAENHDVRASFTTPPIPLFDITTVGVYPHMHLLGKKINVELQRPKEDWQPMITINSWDFNWQGAYYYENPVKVPAGSTVRVTCTYDNSVNNPKNPAKEPRLVRWGEGTEDEMCLSFMGITFDRENLIPFSGNRR